MVFDRYPSPTHGPVRRVETAAFITLAVVFVAVITLAVLTT